MKRLLTYGIALIMGAVIVGGSIPAINQAAWADAQENVETNRGEEIYFNEKTLSRVVSQGANVFDCGEVMRLIEKQTELALQEQIAESESEKAYFRELRENLDNKLYDMNVQALDRETVQDLFEISDGSITTYNDGNMPQVPDDTETVDWMGYQYSKNYKGKTYSLYEVVAKPTGVHGKLFNHVTGGNLIVTKKFSDQLIEFYAAKLVDSMGAAIGNIAGISAHKVLSYIPWKELLFNSDSPELNRTSDASFAYLRCNTTMVYTFVYNDTLNVWEAVMTTHYTVANSSTSFYLTNAQGEFFTEHVDKNIYVHSDHYDDANYAINIMEGRRHSHTNVPVTFRKEGITQSISGRGVYLSIPYFATPGELSL